MDYVVDEEQYALETLSSYTQYLRNRTRESDGRSDAMETDDVKKDVDVRMREASIKRVYTLYTDQDKVRFFKLMFEKVLSASAAAKQLGIHVRTAQRWAKQYEVNPDSIFAKRKKNGRPRILGEEHKKVILDSSSLSQLAEVFYKSSSPAQQVSNTCQKCYQSYIGPHSNYEYALLKDNSSIYYIDMENQPEYAACTSAFKQTRWTNELSTNMNNTIVLIPKQRTQTLLPWKSIHHYIV
ncbi:hypothetical protein VTP01DRAFT_100 [Rhizomucor pusillus]|uniref:uncharacterized protein n=1 Tax=Rhizomucor pusillus TaxID=4840 RepID=UPI0037444BBB